MSTSTRSASLLAIAVLWSLSAGSAPAKETARTFTPKKDLSAVDQPLSKRSVASLSADTSYPLIKVGGPGHNWCKVQVKEISGWVDCREGVQAGEGAGTAPAPAPSEPGFAYYVLSLSWSPAYCLSHPSDSTEQCRRQYGFIVHGLWPQNEVGWPESCASNSTLDPALVDQMLPLMPSKKLIEHEWQKHGTCSSLDPPGYFAKLKEARDRIHIPQKLVEPRAPITADAEQIKKMFIEANPGLTADEIAVLCKKTVSEIRFCMDKELHFRKCGRDVRNQCKGTTLFPPLR